eukprot:363148_1
MGFNFLISAISFMQIAILTNAWWENEFAHNTFLDAEGKYRLYYTPLDNDQQIEIGIEVESIGWIALGISENGQMLNSDIILGWIDDNITYLQNRYTLSTRTTPYFSKDISNDIISSSQINGVTRIRFIRELHPCPSSPDNHEKPLESGTTRLIFAWNDNNPICTDKNDAYGYSCIPEFHGINRGNQVINLLSEKSEEIPMPPDTQTFNITVTNYTVPSKDTTYFCKIIQLPEYSNTQHIIRFDPIISDGNEPIVHHILVYQCPTVNFNRSNIGKEADCDEWANMPDLVPDCRTGHAVAVWAIGGSNYYYPEHVGYQMSGDDDNSLQYVLLEIHYDNQHEIEGLIDNSGMRIYYTPTLRDYDAGILIIGTYSTIFVPPKIPNTTTTFAYCIAECTNITFPDDGINIIASLLHAHSIGVGLKLRHIRNGVELEWIDFNPNYDFNFQQMLPLKHELNILPNDEFIVECYYDSSNRSFTTFGGESTREEVCGAWITYHPKIDIWTCSSEINQNDIVDFFSTAIDNGWWNGTTYGYNSSRDVYYNATSKEALGHYLNYLQLTERFGFCDSGISDEQIFGKTFVIPEAREDFVEYIPSDAYVNCYVSNDSNNLMVVVIVFGSVAAIILVMFACWCYYRSGKTRKYSNKDKYTPMDRINPDNDTNYGTKT